MATPSQPQIPPLGSDLLDNDSVRDLLLLPPAQQVSDGTTHAGARCLETEAGDGNERQKPTIPDRAGEPSDHGGKRCHESEAGEPMIDPDRETVERAPKRARADGECEEGDKLNAFEDDHKSIAGKSRRSKKRSVAGSVRSQRSRPFSAIVAARQARLADAIRKQNEMLAKEHEKRQREERLKAENEEKHKAERLAKFEDLSTELLVDPANPKQLMIALKRLLDADLEVRWQTAVVLRC